ncbi:hypothetical protein G6F22_019374 [Rhizopus arrhizus]|nr:hypothetical protein G6F22_019374 [Rhizopus arrhizus]
MHGWPILHRLATLGTTQRASQCRWQRQHATDLGADMAPEWHKWSTLDHGQHALAFWQDAVCAGVLDSEFRAEPDAGFAGTMSSQNRAGVRLVNFASSPHMIRRSQRQVSRLNG